MIQMAHIVRIINSNKKIHRIDLNTKKCKYFFGIDLTEDVRRTSSYAVTKYRITGTGLLEQANKDTLHSVGTSEEGYLLNAEEWGSRALHVRLSSF